MGQKTLNRVTILGMPNTLPTTLTGPLDVFSQAGQLWQLLCEGMPSPLFSVELVSPTGKEIRCMNGLGIKPHRSMLEVTSTDLIIITAADISDRRPWHKAIIPWLYDHLEAGTKIASICTAAFVLAEAGVLDQRQATTHWGYVPTFRRDYPKVDLRPERLITRDGNIYCSGGINAYAELCFFLVEEFCGFEVAEQCARALVLDGNRSSQNPYALFEYQKRHGDRSILKAQQIMEKQIPSPLDIAGLADAVAMSERNFKRRFKKATGDTPLEYFQRLRIETAKKKLSDSHKRIDHVAGEVGYMDVAFFRSMFKKITGFTPSEYRHRIQFGPL
jgi:transcriptional regulator GlxA family with amidase domain